ncbi:hypothetical protein DFH07DRAFT_963087 [Mycena maculata]|uniref:Uncharacterized protein n=1 Tax=Mycena maculata TaxID=230809 RepID=A0AAD7N617_9AGAR|nr:hypothetical protein DFH07DRAFT_963087 [Mycena maculata]
MSANIFIAADNKYALYVTRATVATNTGTTVSMAGVVIFMEVNMVPSGRVSCIAGAFVLFDNRWKSTTGAIPTGFEQPGFDDLAWPVVVGEEGEEAYPGTGASAPVTV